MLIFQNHSNIKIVTRVSKLLVLQNSKRFYPHNINLITIGAQQIGLVPYIPRCTSLILYVAPNTALMHYTPRPNNIHTNRNIVVSSQTRQHVEESTQSRNRRLGFSQPPISKSNPESNSSSNSPAASSSTTVSNTTVSTTHPVLILKEQYEKIKENLTWSLEKEHLLKDIETYFSNNPLPEMPSNLITPNRDQEEFTKLYINKPEPEELWQREIKHYLSQTSNSICYTPDQYNSEITRNREGLRLLQLYGNRLEEPIFMELIRRIGLTVNNDAIYSLNDLHNEKEVITKDNNEKTFVKNQGEGPTLHNKAYNTLNNNIQNYAIQDKKPLNDVHITEITDNVKNGKYWLMHKKPSNYDNLTDNEKKILIESGDEKHLLIVTTYIAKDEKLHYVAINILS